MYGKRSNGKEHGVVLTKAEVVKSMLDMVGYTSCNNLGNKVIIEPSAGEGAFAIEIIDRLFQSSLIHKFNFQTALQNVYFCELDKENTTILKSKVSKFLFQKGFTFELPKIYIGDYLIQDLPKADIVIGNPPYVRNENIPKEVKELYKKQFKTFIQRSDLYIPFFEKSLHLLKKDGALCFISSNRWLKNQYGKKLRSLIDHNYYLIQVFNLEKASPFEEEVIAYPSIFHIKNSASSEKSLFYELKDINELKDFQNRIYKPTKTIKLSGSNGDWFSYKTYTFNNKGYYSLIEEQNFKIGIGVATGKDSVFIGSDFSNQIEKELLIPILTSKDLKGDVFSWHGNYLINPFNNDGTLVNLNNFPKARLYFHKHKDVLENRHVAKKNSQHWYKTIDKVHISLLYQPKIILPDISGNRFLFIDEGRYYPHHNLYYITSQNIDELKILACFLMSDFVRNQLNENGNKMNGGFYRWQSQNLRKVLIPYIQSVPDKYKIKLKAYYNNMDVDSINELIQNIDFAEIKPRVEQTTLF